MYEINLNDIIWLQITPEGIEFLKTQPYTDKYIPKWKAASEKGLYVPMQMHEMIALFGKYEYGLDTLISMVCYIKGVKETGEMIAFSFLADIGGAE